MNDNIGKTLEMKKWAVVGARQDQSTYGYKIWWLLRDMGYTAYAVNPRGGQIDGETVYTSITDLPETPDVVDMVVNPQIGLNVMEEIAARGIKYVWMQPGTRSDAIRAFAAEKGIELIEDCVLIRLG